MKARPLPPLCAAALRLLVGAAILPTALLAQQRSGESPAEVLLESFAPSTDDADALVARLIAVARSQAQRPIAESLLDLAVGHFDELDEPAAAVAGLRAILADDTRLGATDRAARSALAVLLRVLGDTAGARALDVEVDLATRLLVVGPFGDSGDFFNGVAFRPEREFPAPGSSLEGRFGAVTPTVRTRAPGETAFALGAFAEDATGVWYALHQVRADAARAGYVVVTTRSSFELFVDGERLRSVDRVVERIPERVFVPVVFRAGVNHVLVKTTLEDRDDIVLRYADATGGALRGLTELDPSRLEPVAPQSAEAPPLPAPYVDGLEWLARAARRATPGDGAAEPLRIAAARLAFAANAPDLGNEFLFADHDAANADPRLQLALGELWRAAPDVPAERRDAEARRLLDAAAAALPPDHLSALLRRADVMRGDDRIEDAIHLLQDAIARGRGGRATWARLVDLLDALDDDAGVERAQAMWSAAHPLDVRPLRGIARRLHDRGASQRALDLVDTALAQLPGLPSLLGLSRGLATELGQRELALARLDVEFAANPTALPALRARAETLQALGDRDGARAAWRRCVDAPDAHARDLAQFGERLLWLGDDAGARTCFAASLARRPDQPSVQRLVARLAGDDEAFPRIARFRASRADVDALVAAFAPTDREKAAPSTLLLDRMIVEFRGDGSYSREIHQVRRINDLRGVEAHEEPAGVAAADEVVRLRTIGTDGQSYVPKRVDRKFAMPRLEPGAFVEEVWRDHTRAPGSDPWRGPEFYFRGEDEAFLHTELVLILPPGHPGSVRARAFPATPERVALDAGYEALVFALHDVPRLRPEKLTPPLQDLVPYVTYGEDGSLDPTARIAHVIHALRARVTPPIADATARVVTDVVGDSARAAAIHRFVHETIASEQGGQEATSTLLQRAGPRYFLEVAMFAAAGIPMRMALAQSTSEALSDDPTPVFVGDESFSIPSVQVAPRDGAPFWLFADLPRHVPLGFVPAGRAGAAVLFADNAENARLPAATEGAPGWDVRGTMRIDADGAATLDVQLELRDEPGYGLAQQVRDLDANRRQMIGRSIGAQMFAGWSVVGSKIEPPEPGARFHANLTLKRRGAVQANAGALALAPRLPPSSMFQRYGDAGPRELPLRQSGTTLEDWQVTIDLGDAQRLGTLPSNVRVVSELFDYALTWSEVDGKVLLHRRLAMRPGTIPATGFADWLHRLQVIDRAEEAQIELIAR